MVQSQFSLSWDAYKSSICNGFSSLQQNGELVDMTLAADGHFVKVHQVLIALVSPYLKDIITSAPCQHPVIFLNNVSHRTLSSLLEYIYTGEVLVPSDCLMSFVETAKSLHIKGLENITGPEDMSFKMAEDISQIANKDLCHVTGIKTLAMGTDSGTGMIGIPAAARKVFLKREKLSSPIVKSNVIEAKDEMHDYSDMMDIHAQDSDDGGDATDTQHTAVVDPNTASTNVQYSVSIRGSLQVILNRYIYNLHSTTHRSGVRRWRCVEYRNHRCMAFLVTKDNVVLNRANLHNHAFHDKKILQKIEKKAVFSAIGDVAGYKEKEFDKEADTDTAMENEGYVSLDISDTMAEDVKKDWTEKL